MPGPVTAGQLAFLQTMATTYTLDLTANTTRNTASATAVDQYGNPTETWTAVLTSVACGMSTPSSATQQLYPQAFLGAERKVTLSFPQASDVKRNDRVTIGGRTYRVEVDIGHDTLPLVSQWIGVQINDAFN